MRRWILWLLMANLLWISTPVEAASTTFGIRFFNHIDGTYASEFIYNNQTFWRISILVDGATPVFALGEKSMTVVIPAIEDGCFVLKIR